jgi:hypothetical protein
MKTLKRILGVLLIFLFGVFIGAAITNADIAQKLRKMLLRGPEAVIDGIVGRLDQELKLDPEQKRRLQVIMDDAHIRLRQSRAKVQPEVEATLREAEERTRAILYPAQVKKFDDLVSKGRERWKEKEGATAAPSTPEPTPATPAPVPGTPPPATPIPPLPTPQ